MFCGWDRIDRAFTQTVTFRVIEWSTPFETVNVYVVVLVGLTVTTPPLATDPIDRLILALAPDQTAVRVVESP